MVEHIHLKNISELNQAMKQPSPRHPLVSVIDFMQVDESYERGTKISTDFYSVMFKNYCSNKLKYGRQYFDFQEGNLICIAPKQVIVFDDEIEQREDKMGWGVFFHPDLILGTSLFSKIKEYTFFSYDIVEALHLSEKEKQTLHDCVLKIQNEVNENIDAYSQTLIVSNLELLLNYCSRYYGRQFITRKSAHKSIVDQLKKWIQEHWDQSEQAARQLPTVKDLADQVHLSPSYLSDLLKKETGMNAQEYIHYFLIEEAKNLLLTSGSSISEIAYSLGFDYPQYFTKLFKLKTGKTPLAFRNLN